MEPSQEELSRFGQAVAELGYAVVIAPDGDRKPGYVDEITFFPDSEVAVTKFRVLEKATPVEYFSFLLRYLSYDDASASFMLVRLDEDYFYKVQME